MPVYFVQALVERQVISVATVDTADQAIVKFLDALEEHGRAWVVDAKGSDISIDELARQAGEE